MADYKIVVDGLNEFAVEATSAARFHLERGFPTVAAARRWIAEELTADPQPGTVRGPPDLP